jgi:hypothetical protein
VIRFKKTISVGNGAWFQNLKKLESEILREKQDFQVYFHHLEE